MSEYEIKTAKDFNELLGTEGAGMQSAMSMFNMSPTGWKAAVNKPLPPSERGYGFDAILQDNGRREIVGFEIGGESENAFFVADASPDPILDDATATRIVEGLRMKYRSDDVRKSHMGGLE